MALADWIGGLGNLVILIATWLYVMEERKRSEGIMQEEETYFNQGMDNYLELYVASGKRAEHAVMIDGPWGAGKSYYMQDFIERMEKKHSGLKFITVSLYGIDSVEALENEIFRAACPVLSSKPVIIGKAVVKSLLKGWARVDLDGDGKGDAKINIDVFDSLFDKKEFTPENCVFVFDDVERCELKGNAVWGQINNFVEKEGLKVLFVTNRKELLERVKNLSCGFDFSKVEEKIVGKRVYLKVDRKKIIQNILNSDSRTSEKLKKILFDNIFEIDELMSANKGEAQNFRIFKSVLCEFNIIWNMCDKKVKEDDYFIIRFFVVFFEYYFLLRKGILSFELFGIYTESFGDIVVEKEETEVAKVIDQYWNHLDADLFGLPGHIWVKLFKSECKAQELNNEIKKLHFFRNNEPWVKLWNYIYLEDEDFEQTLKQMEYDLSSSKVDEIGVLFHIMGLIIEFKERKLMDDDYYHVIKQKLYGYIDQLYESNVLMEPRFEWREKSVYKEFFRNEYGGLGYMNRDDGEFVEFREYVRNKIEKFREKRLSEASAEYILTEIREGKSTIVVLLSGERSSEFILDRIPALKYIKQSDITEVFIKGTNDSRRVLCNILDSRYDNLSRRDLLLEEEDWLRGLDEQFRKVKSSESHSVSRILLNSLREIYIPEALGKLSERRIILEKEELSEK